MCICPISWHETITSTAHEAIHVSHQILSCKIINTTNLVLYTTQIYRIVCNTVSNLKSYLIKYIKDTLNTILKKTYGCYKSTQVQTFNYIIVISDIQKYNKKVKNENRLPFFLALNMVND